MIICHKLPAEFQMDENMDSKSFENLKIPEPIADGHDSFKAYDLY